MRKPINSSLRHNLKLSCEIKFLTKINLINHEASFQEEAFCIFYKNYSNRL